MKKFIAAFDGLNFSQSTLQYAMFVARNCQAHLVGVFLEDFTRHSYSVTEITQYAGSFDEHVQQLNLKDQEDRSAAIALFEQFCQDAGLNYTVHRDRNLALQELIHESIYADMVIIDANESMRQQHEEPPTRFIRELLSDIQCPVLLVPNVYLPIEKISLLYDGEPSSVHAVKMFSYLFSSLKNFETEVISVKSENESMHLPDNRLMKEFMKRHYPDAEFVLLKGFAEDEVVHYLRKSKKDVMLVLGAYRRSKVSRWFRPSMADALTHDLKLPLFIAHNRS